MNQMKIKIYISDKKSNEMSENSVERLIDDHNGLNEEAEQLIDKIEHMSVEEEKLDNINDEDMHYDREDEIFERTSRDNDGTVVELLQPSTEGKLYKCVSKQLQFLMNNDTCMKKKIQETMKESEVVNNINTHALMQSVVNMMFRKIHAKKGIKLFGERSIAEMIK